MNLGIAEAGKIFKGVKKMKTYADKKLFKVKYLRPEAKAIKRNCIPSSC